MIEITTAHNEARLAGTLAYISSGTGTAAVQVYSGARPSLGGAPSGLLLASISLATPAGVVTGNQLVLTTPADGLILTSASAGWARIVNRNGDIVADCDVGLADAQGNPITPGDLLLSQIALTQGGTLRLVSGVLG